MSSCKHMRSRSRLVALAMVLALLAGLAHGWLHDAHATPRHFADHSEFCAIDKIAAVAPEAPAQAILAFAAVDCRPRAAAVNVALYRGHAHPRAPPLPIA